VSQFHIELIWFYCTQTLHAT